MGEGVEMVLTNVILLFPLIALGTTAYFVRRFIRAFERRTDANLELKALRERIAQLEEASDDADRAIARLQAAQEFATRLLAERQRE